MLAEDRNTALALFACLVLIAAATLATMCDWQASRQKPAPIRAHTVDETRHRR